MALVQRSGLGGLLAERLAITANGRGGPRSKVIALVAGMFVGADSIDDMDLLRHGGMRRLFTGLIVRRVRQLNPKHAPAGQAGKRGELFAVYRRRGVHPRPRPMLDAEATHRDHAIVEQGHRRTEEGTRAHLPWGFTANAAWLAFAAIAQGGIWRRPIQCGLVNPTRDLGISG
jgi:hypothetical protein